MLGASGKFMTTPRLLLLWLRDALLQHGWDPCAEVVVGAHNPSHVLN